MMCELCRASRQDLVWKGLCSVSQALFQTQDVRHHSFYKKSHAFCILENHPNHTVQMVLVDPCEREAENMLSCELGTFSTMKDM